MSPFHNRIILFTRCPQVGKCKSRLIPALGAEGALSVHKQLVLHVLKILKNFLASTDNTNLYIYYHGGTLREIRQWLGTEHPFKQQQGDTLGERMAAALIHGLEKNQNSILIGSDCPGIRSRILVNALEALQHNEVVLGPAHDGGYYLIGVAKNMSEAKCRQLFEEIHWGTGQVFAQTLKHANTMGLNTHILNKLHDIDTEEDLKHFHYCPSPE
jgi:hypothetical protein